MLRIYKQRGNRTVNNTNNISNNLKQYTTDVVNAYKINKTSNIKKTCYNFIEDVVINQNNTIHPVS